MIANRHKVPVLVVGAGPVGLATACELGWRGIETLVVDAGDGTVTFPAGENIFSRTMEHLRRWGIADEARDLRWPPSDYPGGVAFVTTVAGHTLTTIRPGSVSPYDHASPERPLFQAKFAFDPLLRRRMESFDCVTTAYRHEATAITQDDDGLTVTLRDLDRGQDQAIRASYVVACDGGRSRIRQQAGLKLEGQFGQGRNYAVYFRSAQLRKLLAARGLDWAYQIQTVSSPLRPYLTAVDGGERWRCSAYLDGDANPDPYDVVTQTVGADIDIEVIRAQPWTGHQVVANAYRSGRVFLAGDAAHLRWPKGGFGANTGIGDAVDIGWKLAAVIKGWGGPALLDSYEVERRPIALRNAKWAAENWEADKQVPSGPQLEADTSAGTRARHEATEAIVRLRTKEYTTIGVQLGYRYSNSPICLYDDAAPPPDRLDRYVPSTSPGARAPHTWLADGSSTLDHFGHGFTLVQSGAKPSIAPLLEATTARSVPLTVLEIHDPATRDLYEQDLVLVRPDGHVAWRGAVLPTDSAYLVDVVRGCGAAAQPVRQPLASAVPIPTNSSQTQIRKVSHS